MVFSVILLPRLPSIDRVWLTVLLLTHIFKVRRLWIFLILLSVGCKFFVELAGFLIHLVAVLLIRMLIIVVYLVRLRHLTVGMSLLVLSIVVLTTILSPVRLWLSSLIVRIHVSDNPLSTKITMTVIQKCSSSRPSIPFYKLNCQLLLNPNSSKCLVIPLLSIKHLSISSSRLSNLHKHSSKSGKTTSYWIAPILGFPKCQPTPLSKIITINPISQSFLLESRSKTKKIAQVDHLNCTRIPEKDVNELSVGRNLETSSQLKSTTLPRLILTVRSASHSPIWIDSGLHLTQEREI